MKDIALILGFVFTLWALFSVFRDAKAAEDKESAARPHSNDIPAYGWVIILACTLGAPAFMALRHTDPKPTDAPTWLILTFSAVIAFILSAVLVIVGITVARGIKSSLKWDSPDSPPQKPVSLWQRVFAFALSGLVLAYGIHGLWVDDLYIPGPARAGEALPGRHLHGVSADLSFAGFLVVTLAVLAGQSNSARRGVTFLKYWRLGVWVGAGIMLVGGFWGAR